MAAGLLLFMMGSHGFVNTYQITIGLDYQAEMGDFSLAMAGSVILIMGMSNWWNEDLKVTTNKLPPLIHSKARMSKSECGFFPNIQNHGFLCASPLT